MRLRNALMIGSLSLLLLAPHDAQAAANPANGVMDTFLRAYEDAADKLLAFTADELSWLSYGLAVVDMVFLGWYWASHDDVDVINSAIGQIMFMSFMGYLLHDWLTLTDSLHSFMVFLGLHNATGVSLADFFSPSTIAGKGFTIADQVFNSQATGFWGKLKLLFSNDLIAYSLAMFLIIASFFGISIIILYQVMAFKLYVIAGQVLLPWGLFKHTSFLAENTPAAIVGQAVEMMVLAFIVGIGIPAYNAIPVPNDPSFKTALALMLAAVSIFCFAAFLPQKISARVVGGGPNFAGRRP